MQKENTNQKARDKEEAAALAEGSSKLVKQDSTEAPSEEIRETAESAQITKLPLKF